MAGINLKNEGFKCFVCGIPLADYDAVQKHYRIDHINKARTKKD